MSPNLETCLDVLESQNRDAADKAFAACNIVAQMNGKEVESDDRVFDAFLTAFQGGDA